MLREWEFAFVGGYCEECECSHDISVFINIATDDPEVAIEADGLAWHEAIRSHSPEGAEELPPVLTGRPPHQWNKTYEVQPVTER